MEHARNTVIYLICWIIVVGAIAGTAWIFAELANSFLAQFATT